MTAGLALVGGTFIVNSVLAAPGTPRILGAILVVLGCTLTVLGVVARDGRMNAVLARGALAILSVIFALGLAEATFRALDFNFDLPPRELPICNQSPNVHAGDGILRRSGPATWRGKPLSSLVYLYWGNEDAYPDERAIEIHYDRLGFRNPPELTDWEVVVTGDSFVESGYLPYEQIFTTLAAQRLGIRIKNLGVSGTGAISQTAYVRNYGKAPATRHAVLCFFDGNDASDIFREARDRESIRRTGHRLGLQKQTSLIVALQERLRRPRQRAASKREGGLKPNAFFVAPDREYPVAIRPTLPPRWEDLKNDRQALVAAALADWGKTVRSLGMKPWVLCIPDSRRVLHGHLRYTETNNPLNRWQGGQFGPHLAKICAEMNICFVDSLPRLQREVEAGRMPYNLFFDDHLSAAGSRVVADVLAEALSADVSKRP